MTSTVHYTDTAKTEIIEYDSNKQINQKTSASEQAAASILHNCVDWEFLTST